MSLSAAARQMSEARRELHSAPPPDAATVFLSYASIDRSHIEALASFIEVSGYTVWWDRSIDPGEFFNDRIAKSIDASFAVVVLWSKHSTISRWVNWEARRGLSQNKLIPVATLELKFDDLWPPFGDLNTLRLDDRDRLLAALRRLSEKGSLGRGT